MKINIYISALRNEIFDFINFKQSQGYAYSFGSRGIKYFDRFLKDKEYKEPILTSQLINEYIAYLSKYGAMTRHNRFSVVKEFSAYLKIFKPRSHLIAKNLFRKPPRRRAYIFTDMEICKLLNAAKARKGKHASYGITNYTITGLLAFTGIRISECLSLNIHDWNDKESLLFIEKGKFGKDRIIPVLPSVKQKLNEFILERCKYMGREDDKPLFINKNGKRVRDYDFRRFFNGLLIQLQIKKNCSIDGRKPIIHSLRHTFAVKNILNWLKSGENMDMLPHLSTYMGHISLSSTQIYLQSVKEMKTISSEKFYSLFKNNI